MSVSHIEQFYTRAVGDKALFAKMAASMSGPEDFIRKAVDTGKSLGYDFSFEEADAWIKKQQAIKASGELSDSQLESVAGGKQSSQEWMGDIWNGAIGAVGLTEVNHRIGGPGFGQALGNWFQSW
ncbi:MAG: Nif11-like leader peptide family RiPP precursor [Burkholderiales bacterium]